MQTKVQNMQNYMGYMKCGEILKPPSESYHRPYVLKCIHCKEIYLLFEAFIFHIEDHCKDAAFSKNKTFSSILDNEKTSQDVLKIMEEQMDYSDRPNEKDVNVKLEERSCEAETEDPLIVIKPEWVSDGEYSTIKEELISPKNNNITTESRYVSDREKAVSAERIHESSDLPEICDITTDVDSDCSYEEEEVLNTDSENEEVTKKIGNVWIKKNSDVNGFIKSKENVKVLISAYKNQPSLWNKNYPFLRHKLKRQSCLEHISQELKEQRNININWKLIANIIIFLCRKYREDLKALKDKEYQKDEKKHIPSWFFDELDFLRPFMENNLIAKLDSHLPDLLPHQIIEILEIYREYPHLWNTHLIEYYCKNKRYAAKQAMLKAIEAKMGIEISEHTLEGYFRTIHNCFTRAKSNKLENKKSEVDNTSEDNNPQDYYQYMIFLYDHVGKFKCSECPRSFKSPLYLKLHKTQLHGSDPLMCSLCNKEFKTANSYTNHAKRHMEDLNHECKECGKKFLHATDLRIHMRNHTGAKPFCCEKCGASFRHIQGFSNHRRRHEKNYLHICDICNKGYYSKDRYNDHMNAHSNIRSQICNICGKTFITKRSLQQHIVIHDDIRRHACKVCGKTFKHKTGVNQHMRTHGIANSEEKSTAKKD